MPRRKLEVRQFVPEITPYTLVALMALVATYGIEPELLCEGMPFSGDDLTRGTLVSNRQAWRMIRRALRLTGRADLGLALGQWEKLSDLGPVMPFFEPLFSIGTEEPLAFQEQVPREG